jgi:hypothetical protein
MQRRQTLGLPFLLYSISSSSIARSVARPLLADLCKNSTVIALVDNIKIRDNKSGTYYCGPKFQANVRQVIIGEKAKALEWRGASGFEEATEYLVFAWKVPIVRQIEERSLNLTEEKKEELDSFIRYCKFQQTELFVQDSLPIMKLQRKNTKSVFLGRDREWINKFAPMLTDELLQPVAGGYAVDFTEFSRLVQRLSLA